MEVLEGTASSLLANLAGDLIISFKKHHHVIRENKERLEELLVIIHSVIDAAKVHVIGNKWLRKWLKNLKEAAQQGQQALLLVNRHEKLKSENNGRNKPPDELPLSWNRVLAPLVGAHTFGKKLFSDKDDTAEKLTAALNKVERACRNTELFLKLLKLERKSNSYPGIAVSTARVIRKRRSGSKRTGIILPGTSYKKTDPELQLLVWHQI